MWEWIKEQLTNKGLPMVDRPAYNLGWRDGHTVGKREGYERAISELGQLDANQIVDIYNQHERLKPKNRH